MKDPLYICVHIPEFPVQALLRLRPEKSQSPVVVVEGDPPLEQVSSANVRAIQLGVAHGMTGAELEMFSGVSVLRRSAVEERVARSVLLETAARFTPRIEIQRSAGTAFVMALDMTGTSRIFGPADRSIAAIARAMKPLHFFVQLAASANLHAAVCIAPSARRQHLVIPTGQEEAHLRRLPLAALPLTAQQTETLSLWGLHTLGDLAALPEVDLVVRLGQEGKRLRLLARGEHPHLMVPEEPAFSLEEFIAFDAPVEMLDSLLFVVGPMLDQLLARAQNRCYALASVTIKLGLDGGAEHERTLKPALPVAQREVLLKLLYLDLQAHPPSAGVMNIFLHAEPGDRSKVQMGLFAPQLPEPTRLDVTLARIAALVGEDRVGKAVLLDRHRPDSFKMERFTVPKSVVKEETARHTIALRRCRPPVNLSVQREGRSLASFWFNSRLYKVQQAYGPWRRSGDWWSSEVWSREEWDIQAAADPGNSLLCLITHDLLGDRWQMDALYD
ncbi:protein ImuB [Granulicella aggregans]|uniref:Protein ImuB n=1 Tax=Granulicella aggregans TaxID=474949 RepID=A0A7W7Z997_9BACT|nr:protein ImuB [Granulicella aggregans]